VEIVVYRITGRQGWLDVPGWICAECDLTVAAVREACRRAGVPQEAVDVRPWLTHLGEAWRAGALHPPAVLVDGHLFSQGRVPDAAELALCLTAGKAGGEGRSAAP